MNKAQRTVTLARRILSSSALLLLVVIAAQPGTLGEWGIL